MIELSIPFELDLTNWLDNDNLIFIDEVLDWCVLNNITPPIPYLHKETVLNDRGRATTITLMASFENEHDAILFKMRWL